MDTRSALRGRAWSLRRVAVLSPDAHAALAAALADEHYIVRAITLQTIGHRKLTSFEAAVRRAMGDRHREVRNWAFRVLCAFDVRGLSAVAAGALDSPDGWTREEAVRVLRKRRALTAGMVARLLDHPEWTTRREALYGLGDIAEPVTDVILKALDDPLPYLRNQAVDLAVEHGGDRLTGKLRHMLDTTSDSELAWKLEFALGLRKPGQTGPVRP